MSKDGRAVKASIAAIRTRGEGSIHSLEMVIRARQDGFPRATAPAKTVDDLLFG